MLFSKSRPALTDGTKRETLCDPDGRELIKVNLHYPDIGGKSRDPLMRNAAPFYKRTAESLVSLAKNELLPIASAASAREGFLPFGVTMRWEKTFEDEKYLSVILDISVFDGISPSPPERQTQVWEKKFGLKCSWAHFFLSDAKKELSSLVCPENEKSFEREMFVLRDGGIEFFVRSRSGEGGVFLPFSLLNEKKLLKISV